jgi:uncharacterized membrane protein
VTADQRKRLGLALAVVLSVCFAVLAHLAIIDGFPRSLGALLSVVPISLFVLWAVRRSRHRVAATLLVLVAGAALWFGWSALERNFPSVFFLEHAGANLILAIAFGRTLVGDREPLCTRFARLIHGTLEPDVVIYTRRVTLAWTIYFTAVFTIATLLYLGHQIAAWSLLANILNPILIGAMFVVEYAVRLRALPDHKRVGILGGIRAFSRHFGAARLETPR